MQLVVQFDLDVDIIDVPVFVVENKEVLRRKFLNWIYNPQNKHGFWFSVVDKNGKRIVGLKYRSDAFVKWLNLRILKAENEKARVIAQNVVEYPTDLPVIYF